VRRRIMLGKIVKQTEKNIIWEVNAKDVNPIVINIYNLKNELLETYIHELLYPRPVFGYDVSDVQYIESKLDELIEKHQNN
jgi:hypothetical protein